MPLSISPVIVGLAPSRRCCHPLRHSLTTVRQVLLTYGLHGVAVWFIAADVARYRPLVIFDSNRLRAGGPVFNVVDLNNGMRGSWIADNDGSCLLVAKCRLVVLPHLKF